MFNLAFLLNSLLNSTSTQAIKQFSKLDLALLAVGAVVDTTTPSNLFEDGSAADIARLTIAVEDVKAVLLARKALLFKLSNSVQIVGDAFSQIGLATNCDRSLR